MATIPTGLNILLVEDNVINQALTTRLLQKRGHVVTLAEDGAQASKLWGERAFDVILMDVQMPGVDGFEATALIRAGEAARPGAGRTPIIAMTAHAMEGDRERCLAAGMDDYVSKPIDAPTLFAKLDGLAGQTAVAPPLPAPGSRRLMDLEYLSEQTSGDAGIMAAVAQAFVDTCVDRLSALERAVATGSAKAVEYNAHSLKSAVAVFGANQTALIGQKIEDMGRRGQLEAVREVFAVFEGQILALREEVSRAFVRRSA